MSSREQRSLAASVEGVSVVDFRLIDWGQLALSAMIFGSAFLWIALALRSISPGTISFGRMVLGAAALALIPTARCAVRRVDWSRLVLGSVLGMAAPVLLIALAEERIPSALAGMLVSAIPVMTAVVAAIETRTWPTRNRLVGLTIGLAGIVLLAAPNLSAFGAQAVGVVMVLGAMLSYSISTTLYAPLQQTYGSLRITLWLLIISAVILFPLGILGLPDSTFEPLSVVSLVVLGVMGTGVVWAVFVGLVGRVGAVRASVVGYLIPIVALLLGVVVLDEQIELVQVAGVVVTLVGGYLLSRGRGHGAAKDAGAKTDAAPLTFVESPEVPAIHMCR